jgi:L-serine dehydratase
MRAAARFCERWLQEKGVLDRVVRVRAELYGSLAMTGRGHGTDKAVLLGFEGHHPDTIDADAIPEILARIRATGRLSLLGRHPIAFDEKADLVFNKRQKLPFHTNGMRFSAYDAAGNELATRDYYSVGGGFVSTRTRRPRIASSQTPPSNPTPSPPATSCWRCASSTDSPSRS